MIAHETSAREANIAALRWRHDQSSLGLNQSDWREPLHHTTADEKVGIRHAAIRGDAAYRTHVAQIPKQVGCHYHSQGDEDYAVVQGRGILFFGKVEGGEVKPQEWRSLAVETGDTFVIPEGFAHQLRKTGEEDLIILFGCPDSHLDDLADRFMLPDAPATVGGLTADRGVR